MGEVQLISPSSIIYERERKKASEYKNGGSTSLSSIFKAMFLPKKSMPTSPRSPLDRLFLTMKKSYGVCGVGLGIVAEMEKSGEIPATRALFVQNVWRSNPIPVNKAKTGKLDSHNESSSSSSSSSDSDSDSDEYVTYVTRREGPNRQLMTRVVYSDESNRTGKKVERQRVLEKSVKNSSIFDISPARYSPPPASSPSSDFLNSCHLCKKKLHGKDVYIYRGEKGFCSPECRYRQIAMEKKEQTPSRSSSSSSLSGYSINGGQIILSPEIFAT